MKKILFKGVGTAIVTPFLGNSINYDEFEKLIEFQISHGADSIIVCGTTGESATLSAEEKKYAIRFVVNTVNKRIPVIAGTGSNCTKSAIDLSCYAESVGADGLLIVTPYYNKTTQKGAIIHFTEIAKATNLPIILYNVPSRTGFNLAPSTCKDLSEISNIVAIKEASGNLSQIAQISKLCGDDLSIYSGNDDQILPILSVGGIGVISVLSNIAPQDTHDMIYKFLEGNVEEAKNMQLKAIPLINSLFSEVNPIPIKAALNMMGYQVGTPRLPLIEMSKSGQDELRREMVHYGII